jgi:hypothetical protein
MSEHRRDDNAVEPLPTLASSPPDHHRHHTITDGGGVGGPGIPIPQAVLAYHESAHSIVFRDHLRRQQGEIRRRTSSLLSSASSSVHGGGGVGGVGISSSSSSSSSAAGNTNIDMGGCLGKGGEKVGGEKVGGDKRRGEDDDAAGYESGGSRGSSRSRDSFGSGSRSGGGGSMSSGGGTTTRHRNRMSHSHSSSSASRTTPPAIIANFQPVIEPLEPLGLHSTNVFEPLLHHDEIDDAQANNEMTDAEFEVMEMLINERAVVKTIRNADWSAFLMKFKPTSDAADGDGMRGKGKGGDNDDVGDVVIVVGRRECHPSERKQHRRDASRRGMKTNATSTTVDTMMDDRRTPIVLPPPPLPFNSFVTSTSLLPSRGKKMRCFGSTSEYAIGVVFALPTAHHHHRQQLRQRDDDDDDASSSMLSEEDDEAKRTLTWAWPSGYSAKTEYNIDDDGKLINGREDALVSFTELRNMNRSYLHDVDYVVGGRMVMGGLTTVPYNEVYVRVGGVGRIVGGVDVCTGRASNDADGSGRSFDDGKDRCIIAIAVSCKSSTAFIDLIVSSGPRRVRQS